MARGTAVAGLLDKDDRCYCVPWRTPNWLFESLPIKGHSSFVDRVTNSRVTNSEELGRRPGDIRVCEGKGLQQDIMPGRSPSEAALLPEKVIDIPGDLQVPP